MKGDWNKGEIQREWTLSEFSKWIIDLIKIGFIKENDGLTGKDFKVNSQTKANQLKTEFYSPQRIKLLGSLYGTNSHKNIY